jgi:hypothetical protein
MLVPGGVESRKFVQEQIQTLVKQTLKYARLVHIALQTGSVVDTAFNETTDEVKQTLSKLLTHVKNATSVRNFCCLLICCLDNGKRKNR